MLYDQCCIFMLKARACWAAAFCVGFVLSDVSFDDSAAETVHRQPPGCFAVSFCLSLAFLPSRVAAAVPSFLLGVFCIFLPLLAARVSVSGGSRSCCRCSIFLSSCCCCRGAQPSCVLLSAALLLLPLSHPRTLRCWDSVHRLRVSSSQVGTPRKQSRQAAECFIGTHYCSNINGILFNSMRLPIPTSPQYLCVRIYAYACV